MSLSKIYLVKSNAARAAKRFGLGRDALQQVEGGWVFELPAIAAAVVDSALEDIGQTDTAPAAEAAPTPAKPKRRSTSEAAANLRKAKAAAKPAKKPKKRKAAKSNGKRHPGPKSGKVAEVIAELKARWTKASDILEKTGWCSNTFRGVLGIHKIKTGEQFERKKVDGETYYRIAA